MASLDSRRFSDFLTGIQGDLLPQPLPSPSPTGTIYIPGAIPIPMRKGNQRFVPSESSMEVEERDSGSFDPTPRFRTTTISEGTRFSSKTLPTVFKWEGNGKDVFISGSFNQWKSKIPLRKSVENFYTIVDLPEGEHDYKYLVDGQWKCNEKQASHDTAEGRTANFIKVEKSDFEVFEALALDCVNSGTTQSVGLLGAHEEKGAGDTNEEFGQVIPKIHTEKSTPPVLPPHLLQVILNKDVSQATEPSLLPEPNHVMLNHLYALSIRDGVMVLSATHRFRKRFVTTLFYKPIP